MELNHSLESIAITKISVDKTVYLLNESVNYMRWTGYFFGRITGIWSDNLHWVDIRPDNWNKRNNCHSIFNDITIKIGLFDCLNVNIYVRLHVCNTCNSTKNLRNYALSVCLTEFLNKGLNCRIRPDDFNIRYPVGSCKWPDIRPKLTVKWSMK